MVYSYYLGNRPLTGKETITVLDKYDQSEIAQVSLADESTINLAISLAEKCAPIMKKMPSYERQEILNRTASLLTERSFELASILSKEAGKPIREARAEVERATDTFRIAAEESTRIRGEVLPMDISPRGKNYTAFWKRFPIGVCSFISPFNFPLNLAAHKIAPAIACGCPFILKPASLTPISSLVLGEILSQTSLPEGAFSILPSSRECARLLTTDERIKLLSFTGSPAVGWELKSRAGKKKVVLELGGNAACIIDEDADLNFALERILIGTFLHAGQSCISVQRILIHEKLYDKFKSMLIESARGLKAGDPKLEETSIGPMISEGEARRLENWVEMAVKQGARILCGGKRRKNIFEPTLLEKVPLEEKICSEEAFGPIAVLTPFHNFKEAIKISNHSRFGLQCGIFSQNLNKAHFAWDELEVGGVVIGDIPTFRMDHMPYGGIKESGLGREGVRFAMEEMTEIKILILKKGEV